jgi:hypothetical protein
MTSTKIRHKFYIIDNPRKRLNCVHAELASLPMTLSGLGIRSISSIAHLAYRASSQPDGDSQDVLTAALDKATAERLGQGDLGAEVQGTRLKGG